MRPFIAILTLALASILAPTAAAQCERHAFGPPIPEFLDVFGWSVALAGPVAVVGSIGADDLCPTNPNCDSGSAFVYEEVGGLWTLTATLAASDGAQGDQFGQNVAVSGDRILVGAHLNLEGAAYVFRRAAGGWVEEQKLTGSDSQPFFHFGHSVALDEDTALIGVMRDTHAGNEAGSAFVFQRVAGTWVELAKLTASDASPGSRFGRSCDLDSDVAVIGAHVHDHGAVDSGAAYLYERFDNHTPNDPLDDTWLETHELLRPTPLAGALFGRSVGVSGDTVVVGAAVDDVAGVVMGAVYIYERGLNGWALAQRVAPHDGAAGDHFGESVAIDGDRLVVGAVFHGAGGVGAGAAYHFERTPLGWVETSKIVASDAATGASFGAESAVDVSGSMALFGAPLSDAHAMRAGASYVVDLSGCLGASGCVVVPNSTGVAGEVSASGSVLVHRNDLRIDARRLPTQSFGFFIVSRTGAFVVAPGGSQGNLCLGGLIGRYVHNIFNTGTSGGASLQIDLSAVPSPVGPYAAAPGETLHFQAWHRDSVAGAPTSNFAAALSVELH